MLQGFEQYFFKKEPELTISQTRGVFFNTGTVQALGKCEYVQIFFKDSERLLAIQFAKKLDNCAVPLGRELMVLHISRMILRKRFWH